PGPEVDGDRLAGGVRARIGEEALNAEAVAADHVAVVEVGGGRIGDGLDEPTDGERMRIDRDAAGDIDVREPGVAVAAELGDRYVGSAIVHGTRLGEHHRSAGIAQVHVNGKRAVAIRPEDVLEGVPAAGGHDVMVGE